jgi:pyridoxine/pyridoxamine 5'-phosphate oxidase
MSYQDDRKEYRAGILDDSMMTCDPMELFSSWLAAYRDTGAEDATAFALSTVSAQLEPDARIVLLKGLTEGKMLFYTHYRLSRTSRCACFVFLAKYGASNARFWICKQSDTRREFYVFSFKAGYESSWGYCK